MSTYRGRALEIARSQIGVHESPAGSNSGAKVREYQAATTLGGTGWPWCAAFVNWCFLKAGKPLDQLGRSASVAVLLAAARQKGWAHNGTPRPGDLVCYDWDSMTGPGHGDHPDHIGIVEAVGSGGQFTAIEGNTSLSNQSNGGAVMRRADRNMAMVEGFIRVPGGWHYILRYRVFTAGKAVGDYRLKIGAKRRLGKIINNLQVGKTASVKYMRIRKEDPNA